MSLPGRHLIDWKITILQRLSNKSSQTLSDSQPGGLVFGIKVPRPLGTESTGAPQVWGKQDSTIAGHTMLFMCRVPGQSRDSIRICFRTTCGFCRVSWQRLAQLWLSVRPGHWSWRAQGISTGVSSPGGHLFGKLWPHPSRLRSPSPNNRVGTQ